MPDHGSERLPIWDWLLRKIKKAPAATLVRTPDGSLTSRDANSGLRANLEALVRNGNTSAFVEESLRERGSDISALAAEVLSESPVFAEALARDMVNTSAFLKKSGSERRSPLDNRLEALLPEGWAEETLGEIRAKNSGLQLMDRGRAAHLLMRAIDRNPGLVEGTTIEDCLRRVVESADQFVSGNAEMALDTLRRAKLRPKPSNPSPLLAAAKPTLIAPGSSAPVAPAVSRDVGRGSIGEKPKGRVLRVFVSSTFRDMQAERDELVKRVFPRLRKLCEERSITWGQVELRWGITDEQKTGGKLLPIIMEEIERCRPCFLGVLGERYGSSPETLPDSVIAQRPWLAKYRARSVTELEILHGVLNHPDAAKYAFFYFRDPMYPDGLEPEPLERRNQLHDLKRRIHQSGVPIRENYPDPKTFGEQVYEDMKAVVEKEFPADDLSSLEREAADHDFFAESRLGIYVGGQEYLDRLEQHAGGDGKPLVLVGPSGSGKSALLANWGVDYRKRHPDRMLFLHFVGATRQSADWAAMVRRILEEIGHQLRIEIQVPDRPEMLRQALVNALYAVAAKASMVLVLDGLNQLEDRAGARDLAWLPEEIPPNIRLVASTAPGPTLHELSRRAWTVLPLEPLTVSQRKEVIGRVLQHEGRALAEAHISRIAKASQCGSPLYLRTLIEELQLVGSHELLGECIDHYLNAPGPAELVGKVLERLERDYEAERTGLLRDAMSLLWAARRGLSEVELLDLLGVAGEPIPQAHLTPLLLAAERHLINRAGVIGFSDDFVAEAVRRRYLPGEAAQGAAHSRLAGYFAPRDIGPRKVDEWPWQLEKARHWALLAEALSELQFFAAVWSRDETDVKTYWAAVQMNTKIRAADAYRPYLDHPDKLVTGGRWLAYLLCDLGNIEEAAHLAQALIVQLRRSGELAELERALDDAGTYLRLLGHLDEAFDAHRQAEKMAREFNDYAAVASCIGNQATVLRIQGKLDEAMRLLEEQEVIKRSIHDIAGLGICLGNRALILQRKGDLVAAMALHREEEAICRRLRDHAGLATSLINQSTALTNQGDTARALAFLDEAETLCRSLDDLANLQAALGSRVIALYERREVEAALRIAQEQERICRQIGHQEGLAQSLSHQATLHGEKRETDEAVQYFRQSSDVYQAIGDRSGAARVLASWGRVLLDNGDVDGAVDRFAAEEELRIGLGDSPRWLAGKTIKAGPNRLKASLRKERGDLRGAIDAFREEARIHEDAGDYAGLGYSLRDQGLILQQLGEPRQALTIHRQEQAAFRRANMAGAAASAQLNQALLLANLGETNEAFSLAEDAARFSDLEDGPKNATFILQHIRAEATFGRRGQNTSDSEHRCERCGKVGKTRGGQGRPVVAATESLLDAVGRCLLCGVVICCSCAKQTIPAPGLVHFICPDCGGRISPA
jgi:tetratricopeptide (TPR) repeat protein